MSDLLQQLDAFDRGLLLGALMTGQRAALCLDHLADPRATRCREAFDDLLAGDRPSRLRTLKVLTEELARPWAPSLSKLHPSWITGAAHLPAPVKRRLALFLLSELGLPLGQVAPDAVSAELLRWSSDRLCHALQRLAVLVLAEAGRRAGGTDSAAGRLTFAKALPQPYQGWLDRAAGILPPISDELWSDFLGGVWSGALSRIRRTMRPRRAHPPADQAGRALLDLGSTLGVAAFEPSARGLLVLRLPADVGRAAASDDLPPAGSAELRQAVVVGDSWAAREEGGI